LRQSDQDHEYFVKNGFVCVYRNYFIGSISL